MFRSVGKLVYSPQSHLGDSSKWLVVMADDEICRYYSSLFYKEFPYLGKLIRPVFGAHISVIRGERISNKQLWRLDENKIIEFEYEPGVRDNGEYYWLKVKCDYLCDLREKYGLSRYPQFDFHLTIGRTTQHVDYSTS
jgi:hypothetical protein